MVPDLRIAVRLFLGIGLLLVSASSGHLYTMDDHTNFQVAYGLVSRGSVELTEVARERHLNITRSADGKAWSYYGIGGPILFLPGVLLGKLAGSLVGREAYLAQAGMSLTNSFLTAFTAALIYLLVRDLGRKPRHAFTAAAFYVVCTPALVWSKHSFNSVAVGALFLAAVLAFRRAGTARLVLGAAFLGFAVNVRYDAILGGVLLLLFHAANGRLRVRDLPILIVTFVPFAGILLGYNFARFGDPLTLGYPDLAGGDPFGAPLHVGLYGLLFSPNTGLFFYAPVLFTCFAGGSSRDADGRRFWGQVLILSTVYVLFYAKNRAWHGGLGWGPRYLACVLPLLATGWGWLPSAWVEGWGIRRLILMGLVGVTLAIQVIGLTVSVDSYHDVLVEAGLNPLEATRKPSLSPILGNIEVIRRFRFHQTADLPERGLLPQGGHPATRNLRYTPDFWPFYAMKVGTPWFISGLLWLAVFTSGLVIAHPLWRRRETSAGT